MRLDFPIGTHFYGEFSKRAMLRERHHRRCRHGPKIPFRCCVRFRPPPAIPVFRRVFLLFEPLKVLLNPIGLGLGGLGCREVADGQGSGVPTVGVGDAVDSPEKRGVFFGRLGQREVFIGRFTLVDRDGAQIELFGVGVLRLFDTNVRELIKYDNAVDVVAPEALFLKLERSLEEALEPRRRVSAPTRSCRACKHTEKQTRAWRFCRNRGRRGPIEPGARPRHTVSDDRAPGPVRSNFAQVALGLRKIRPNFSDRGVELLLGLDVVTFVNEFRRPPRCNPAARGARIQVMALREGGDNAKPECKANADELGRVGAVPHAPIPHHAESFGVKLFCIPYHRREQGMPFSCELRQVLD